MRLSWFGVIAAIIILGIFLGLVIPALFPKRTDVGFHCQNNLKELAHIAILYADTSGEDALPFGKGDRPMAHQSLQMLADFLVDLKPELFTCPEWGGDHPERDAAGKIILTENNCSYAWTARRLARQDLQGGVFPMASDKFIRSEKRPSGHQLGMNVVYTDGHVEFILEKDLGGPDGLPRGLTR